MERGILASEKKPKLGGGGGGGRLREAKSVAKRGGRVGRRGSVGTGRGGAEVKRERRLTEENMELKTAISSKEHSPASLLLLLLLLLTGNKLWY